jgi:hypothetical protein
MICAPKFTSKAHKRGVDLAPDMVSFLNPTSLGIIDDMFFRLPFPDIVRMEKVHEMANVQKEVATFLSDMKADLAQPRFMSDLHKGWEAYIEQHIETKVPAGRQRADKTIGTASRRARNNTPSSDEDGVEVCSP